MGHRRTWAAAAVLVAAMLLGVSAAWTGESRTAAADVGQQPDPTEPSPTETQTLQPEQAETPPEPTFALELSRQNIQFGAVPVGQRAEQRLTVANAGTAPLQIETVDLVDGNPDAFAVQAANCTDAALAPGSSCELVTTFRPTGEGQRAALLQVTYDDPDDPRRVALAGAGVTAPDIELSHGTVAFGDVVAGEQRAESVTVTSVGTAALAIDTVAVDGGDAFSVASDGCSQQRLAPQSSCDVTVVFAPASEGEASAQLVVTSRGADGPHAVSLTGTGRAQVDGHVVVPDVEGLSLAEADDAVSAAGLHVDVIAGEERDDARVIQQDPPGGTRAPPGTRVAVEVEVAEVVEVAAEESPDDPAASWPFWLAAGLLALVAAGLLAPLTQAVGWLRRHRPRWVRRHLRFEPLVSSPELSADAIDQDASHAVRVAVHHDPGTQTVHEVTP